MPDWKFHQDMIETSQKIWRCLGVSSTDTITLENSLSTIILLFWSLLDNMVILLEGWFGRVVVLEFNIYIYIVFWGTGFFYECGGTRNGIVAVFFIFWLWLWRSKSEIWKNDKNERYGTKIFFQIFCLNIQYSGSSSIVFYSIGILNQEKWEVNI